MKQSSADIKPSIITHTTGHSSKEYACPMRPTYLRLSITDTCNQCCIYCRPAKCSCELMQAMSIGEIKSVVKVLAQAGINKVRITGGEPLMRADLPEIAHMIASIPGIDSVGVTTNGVKLAECAHQLRQAGVTNINISLDSLDPNVYERITGTNTLKSTLDGLHAAVGCGFDAVKINTVVMNGINDNEVSTIASLSYDMPIETRFIELMPLNNSVLDWKALFVPAKDIRNRLGELVPVPSAGGSTAKTYRVPGTNGQIGIIAPVTEPFCGICNRVRVTCSGILKPCLRLPLSYDILQVACNPDAENKTTALLDHALAAKKRLIPQVTAEPVPVHSMSSIGG